jgi:hypothetical protein
MPIENRPCMAIVLGTDLVLAKELRWPMQEFTVENKTYEDAGFGNWTAFYDWLRSSDSSLLGVRYWLRDDLHFLGDSVKNKDYAEVEAGRQIEIYFSGRREVDQNLSCDQEFLYDAVFCSSDGTYAIGFGMEGLTEADIDHLTNAGVKWAEAKGIVRDEP